VARIKVEEYIEGSGSCPYRLWFDRLPPSHAAKVAVAVQRLTLGNTSGIKWFGGLGELRIDWGPGIRVYLAMALLDDYKLRKKQKPPR